MELVMFLWILSRTAKTWSGQSGQGNPFGFISILGQGGSGVAWALDGGAGAMKPVLQSSVCCVAWCYPRRYNSGKLWMAEAHGFDLMTT